MFNSVLDVLIVALLFSITYALWEIRDSLHTIAEVADDMFGDDEEE